MVKWKSIYWKLFNIAGRIVGSLFFIVGLTMDTYGLISLREASPKIQSFEAWIMIVAAFVVAILGFLLMIARPYQPEDSKKEREN